MSLRAMLALVPMAGGQLFAQAQLAGSGSSDLHMMNTDLAVLEAQDVRKDLGCTVTPMKPVLGFDLRFHSGYDVNVPLKELSGTENRLTILFRVTPDSHKDQPVYWFPTEAVVEVETPKQHWRNTHRFLTYKQFSVATEEHVAQK